jgi:hypothetical protein
VGQTADVVKMGVAEQYMPDFGLLLLVQHVANRSCVQQNGFIQQKTIQERSGCFSPIGAQDSKFHAILTRAATLKNGGIF